MPRRRPPGRPTRLLEDEVRTRLIQTIRLGVPIDLACQSAGVAESSFYNWMARGRDEFEARADGEDPDDAEQVYLDLFEKAKEARALAAVGAMSAIQKAAAGGQITEETVRKFRDPETGELVEERTVKRTAPDWRAGAWYLERSHRTDFGKGAEQVEITGADGGPVQVNVDAADLAQRLSETMTAAAAITATNPLALTTGDTEGDGDH